MIAFVFICRILAIQVIGHKQHFKNDKHDEQLGSDDGKYYFCPTWQVAETVII